MTLLLYKVIEAARLLNVPRSTAYELVKNGSLKSIRIPAGEGRAIRIPASELEKFIQQQMEGSA